MITFQEFEQVELQADTIIEVEEFPRAKKLHTKSKLVFTPLLAFSKPRRK